MSGSAYANIHGREGGGNVLLVHCPSPPTQHWCRAHSGLHGYPEQLCPGGLQCKQQDGSLPGCQVWNKALLKGKAGRRERMLHPTSNRRSLYLEVNFTGTPTSYVLLAQLLMPLFSKDVTFKTFIFICFSLCYFHQKETTGYESVFNTCLVPHLMRNFCDK